MKETQSLTHIFRGPSRRARTLALLRRYFLGGVLVTAPIGFALYATWALVRFFDRTLQPLIPDALDPARLLPEQIRPFGVPGFGLLVVVLAMVVIGWLASRAFGRAALRLGERVVGAVPVARSVHGTLKQVFETLLTEDRSAFREVVMFQYPRLGSWALGFVSGETRGEVQARTEKALVNVFLPTTPNPTSGFLIFVPRDEVVALDMTVEEGMRMIISAGIVTPSGGLATGPGPSTCETPDSPPSAS